MTRDALITQCLDHLKKGNYLEAWYQYYTLTYRPDIQPNGESKHPNLQNYAFTPLSLAKKSLDTWIPSSGKHKNGDEWGYFALCYVFNNDPQAITDTALKNWIGIIRDFSNVHGYYYNYDIQEKLYELTLERLPELLVQQTVKAIKDSPEANLGYELKKLLPHLDPQQLKEIISNEKCTLQTFKYSIEVLFSITTTVTLELINEIATLIAGNLEKLSVFYGLSLLHIEGKEFDRIWEQLTSLPQKERDKGLFIIVNYREHNISLEKQSPRNLGIIYCYLKDNIPEFKTPKTAYSPNLKSEASRMRNSIINSLSRYGNTESLDELKKIAKRYKKDTWLRNVISEAKVNIRNKARSTVTVDEIKETHMKKESGSVNVKTNVNFGQQNLGQRNISHNQTKRGLWIITVLIGVGITTTIILGIKYDYINISKDGSISTHTLSIIGGKDIKAPLHDSKK